MRNNKVMVASAAPQSANNMAAVQKFNNEQIITKGFRFTTPAGGKQNFPVQLGGESKFLFGIVVFSDDTADTLSLEVNNEKIIDNVVAKAYDPGYNVYKESQFYSIPRVLNGADTVNFTVESAGSHNIYIVFYIKTSR